MPLGRIQAISFDKVDAATLAKLLKMNKSGINSYIDSVIRRDFQNLTPLEIEHFGKIRAYIYKKGVFSQILAVLKYELSDVRTALTYLYTTLENNSGGLADYITQNHLIMDNNTITKIYSVIDKSIKNSTDAGYIRKSESDKIAQWALARIYELQNKTPVVHAMDLYRSLK